MRGAAPEPRAAEAEDEMLLDEIVEDSDADMPELEFDDDEADALPSAVPGDPIEPVQWPVARGPVKGPASKGEGNIGGPRASASLRPPTERSSVESLGRPRQEPGLGTTLSHPEVPSPSGWELGPAVRRPTLDRSEVERDWYSRERAVLPGTEAGRAEPRLQTPPAPAQGADKQPPARFQPAPGGMREPRPRTEPVPAGSVPAAPPRGRAPAPPPRARAPRPARTPRHDHPPGADRAGKRGRGAIAQWRDTCAAR